MLLLAIDTSTPAVSVALCRDGVALATETVVDARRHNELLAVSIEAVLDRAGVTPRQVDAVAAGVGPGPYTGLRVGLMTARALAHALGIPAYGICSLDVLARAAARAIDGEFVVATDARRKEVYWASYAGGERISGPSVDKPAEVPYAGPLVGEGGVLYPEAFPGARPPLHPDPVDLAAIVEEYVAAGRETLPLEPLYLRKPDAAPPGARKRALG
ncbi:tRNA (adenosine(37)-N6)-threonylcarbamoyltransferase complex dimerization subunit type 1 TsaB [Sporichthya sp.]|uniref:tRNA (adenosine(37)-N6)-threonylcarbamoyltransferase complex dimerization subunit type 1 TsaB n=1 Tax=Sporichthya sp. TaxID=65475 RepID=UPI0017D6216A|nr:tRNA (adenosine(37)-N6)-threonylcarbamoyltransferase complex dimerization subunit type 1 TsaB [Sporichthya sp.]MBA3745534.1 tRNA (adenosine(37)-N6)-threonylcarbamoyltransferase complex dimerization subunit type 1 TsaB [Sporichthya sp.]